MVSYVRGDVTHRAVIRLLERGEVANRARFALAKIARYLGARKVIALPRAANAGAGASERDGPYYDPYYSPPKLASSGGNSGGVDGTRNPEEKHRIAPRSDGSCENTVEESEPSGTAYQGDDPSCSSVVRGSPLPDGEPIADGLRDALEAWRRGPDARELRRRLLDVLRMLDDG
jgi:hypothetical protein